MDVQNDNTKNPIRILAVTEEARLEDVKDLFREYAQSLDIDLCFQNFEDELKTLPGKYRRPEGALIIALVDDKSAGCVALRKFQEGIGEMKRLYVRQGYRGLGIGKKLVSLIIEEASRLDYAYIRLDTLDSMKEAISLYQSFGFYDIEPYIFNPIKGARFMEMKIEK